MNANGGELRTSERAVLVDVARHLPPVRRAWRTRAALLAVAALLCSLVPASRAAQPITNGLPEAAALLSEIRARLPARPVTLQGRLITNDADDTEKGTQRIEIQFQPGAGASLDALYILRDAFGRELERLQVTRPRQAGAPVIRAFRGDPPLPASQSDWSAPIPGATVSWMDLTLGFLWWPDARTIGRQEVKDQECYVVDIQAPAKSGASYTVVRLWVEIRARMMLRAEGFDTAGRRLRQITIKSVRKVDGQWMVKDLEIANLENGERTRLQVDETITDAK